MDDRPPDDVPTNRGPRNWETEIGLLTAGATLLAAGASVQRDVPLVGWLLMPLGLLLMVAAVWPRIRAWQQAAAQFPLWRRQRWWIVGSALIAVSVTFLVLTNMQDDPSGPPPSGQSAGLSTTTAALSSTAAPSPTDKVSAEPTEIADLTRTLTTTPTRTSAVPPPTRTPAPTPTLAPLPASVFIGGDGGINLPDGEPGVVSTIVVGATNGYYLPVIVRNNTGQEVEAVGVSAVLKGSDGTIRSGGVGTLIPPYLAPGQVAIGFGYFNPSTGRRTQEEFEWELTWFPSKRAPLDGFASQNLEVIAAERDANRITVTIRNPGQIRVDGPFQVVIACLSRDAVLLETYTDYPRIDLTDRGSIFPGESAEFEMMLASETAPPVDCPTYLIAAKG